MSTPASSVLTGDSTDSPLSVATEPEQSPAAEPEASAPVSGIPALVPYLQSSTFQRAQGLRSARVILDAAYLFLEPAQWQQALDYLQLPLHVRGGQATFLPDGLGALVHYLEAQYRPKPTGELPGFTAPGRPDAALRLLADEPRTKQTHAIHNSLIEQLVRVSHWRRQSRTWFVNAALAQLLSQYPEALLPVPGDDEE
ncbi:MAG: hypothetical protein EOO62_38795 [Hymenobacter sp.]|nr:MAG: hypothetical protein EOO62_38795 [Hymenobacter sp.]